MLLYLFIQSFILKRTVSPTISLKHAKCKIVCLQRFQGFSGLKVCLIYCEETYSEIHAKHIPNKRNVA